MNHTPFVRLFEADGAASGGGTATAAAAAPQTVQGVPAGATLDDVLMGKVHPSNATTNLPPGKEGEGAGTKSQSQPDIKDGAKAADEQKASEPKTDEVLKSLEANMFGTGKPEDRVKDIEKKYEASSKESVRLNKMLTTIKEQLAEQGVDLIVEDGAFKAFAPKKGAKAKDAAKLEFEKLPDEIKEAFSVDPQAALDHIWTEAQKAFVRVTPDEKYVPPISDERRALALDSLRGEKTIDGEPRYPDLEKYAGMAEAFLSGKSAPQELKDFRSQHPDLALKMALAVVKQEMEVLTAVVRREQEKKKPAQQPSLGPSSQGMSGEAPTDYATRMATAIREAVI